MNNNREPEKINTNNNRSNKKDRPVGRSRLPDVLVKKATNRYTSKELMDLLQTQSRMFRPFTTGIPERHSEDLGWTRCRLEASPLEGTGFYPDTTQGSRMR